MLNTIKAWHNRTYTDYIVIPYDDGYYELSSNEKLIFGVKKKKNNEYLIRKILTSKDFYEDMNGYLLNITTKEMNIPEGRYVYDIVLQQTNGERIPIICPSVFRVLHSVVGSEESDTEEYTSDGGSTISSTIKWNKI